MSDIERRPLAPIGKTVGSISPEDVRKYADDLFREAWTGSTAYHPDGGLKDFDDRIDGLSRAIEELHALEQRIPESPGRRAVRSAIEQARDGRRELWKALLMLQFKSPYEHEPKLDFQDYGPFILPHQFEDMSPRTHHQVRHPSNAIGISLERRGRHAGSADQMPAALGGLLGPAFRDHTPRRRSGASNVNRVPGGLLGHRWR